jgi:CBS domain-containing protein
MTVREVMTLKPVTLQASIPVIEAARAMSEHNLGDVVVQKNGKLCGIVTDRDIVIRVLGSGKDPKITSLESICSQELATISPDQPTSDAVRMMRERAIRRLPLIENDHVVDRLVG